jgi:hypothetical protein
VRRPLRWPRVWLSLWLLAVLAVIAVSLLPPPPLPSAPGSDKLGHFLAYFGLMACAVQVFAGRVLIVIALLLVALGLALEFAHRRRAGRVDRCPYAGRRLAAAPGATPGALSDACALIAATHRQF